MRTKLFAGVAFVALTIPASALAQSTGSTEAEEIVVTGYSGPVEINGFQVPNSTKAKAVITQELIERRVPGQTILDTINQIPGVSFTNSDAYGASGGQIRMRGFDGARISLTQDGIPLNDSGNYSIYSNQQLDPELIEQVNVNFGSADVDAPTASASGGTVNYRSRVPSDDFGVVLQGTAGTSSFLRVFGMVDTGVFTSFGTKAWVSASSTEYDQFRGPGKLRKEQYNARVYQPLGGSDFIAVSGHFNQGRNNFYSNPSLSNLRTVLGAPVVPGSGATAENPYTLDLSREQYDAVFNDTSTAFRYSESCELPSTIAAGPGTQDDSVGCSFNSMNTAMNPGNTGNARINSRFTLSDKLLLTFDGSYQYVKANGGGSALLREDEAPAPSTGSTYNRQGGRLAGVDINRDGDLEDLVRVYFPSNTRTQRLTALVGLRYKIDDDHSVRLAYTWDRARHRQTGEASLMDAYTNPQDPFGTERNSDYLVRDENGYVFTKRDRLSYAILHQISGEYRGSFFDDALNVSAGIRAPFFRRNLNNYCYTIAGSSNDAYCTTEAAGSVNAAYGDPYTNRVKTYSAVLPTAGFTYKFAPALSVFGSFSKGFSAPRTDNLYSFDDVKIAPTAEVQPEKTNSFDAGFRYTTRLVQAQVAGWYISYNNRIISSLVELEGGETINIDRNVGEVRSKGIDASIAVRPVRPLSLYGFVSYTDSELMEDAVNPLTGAVLAATKGKFVVETPKWQYGGRAQLDLGPVSFGVQAKHTGDRYVTDVNDLISKGYTLVDLDARIDLGNFGIGKSYFQLNATNLLKERYFGNLSTGTSYSSSTRYTFGAPRTITGTLHVAF